MKIQAKLHGGLGPDGDNYDPQLGPVDPLMLQKGYLRIATLFLREIEGSPQVMISVENLRTPDGKILAKEIGQAFAPKPGRCPERNSRAFEDNEGDP